MDTSICNYFQLAIYNFKKWIFKRLNAVKNKTWIQDRKTRIPHESDKKSRNDHS